MPVVILNRRSFTEGEGEELADAELAAALGVAYDASVQAAANAQIAAAVAAAVGPTSDVRINAAVAAAVAAANDATGDNGSELHGQDITFANTGHRQSALSTFGSPVDITQSWLNSNNGGSKDISRFRFDSLVDISIAGLSFTDCQFYEQITRGTSFTGVGDVSMLYCTHFGTMTIGNIDYTPYNCLDTSGLTGWYIERGSFRGWGHGPVWNSDTTLVECIFGSPSPYDPDFPPDGSHQSTGTIQANATSNFSATACKFLGYRDYDDGHGPLAGMSGAFVIYDDATHPGPIDFTRCYFSGGQYACYVGAESSHPAAQAEDVNMIDCMWGREAARFSGANGRIADPHAGFSETGSVWGPRGPFWQSGDPEEGDPV